MDSILGEKEERETEELKNALQGTGRGLISGGAKAIKDLEREQKSRLNRAIKDEIDGALLDYSTLLRDSLLEPSQRVNTDLNDQINQIAQNVKPNIVSLLLSELSQTRELLTTNASQTLLLERLFLSFTRMKLGN